MKLFNTSTKRKTTLAGCAAILTVGVLSLSLAQGAAATTYTVDPSMPPSATNFTTMTAAITAIGNGTTTGTVKSGDTIIVKPNTGGAAYSQGALSMVGRNSMATGEAHRIVIMADPALPIGSIVLDSTAANVFMFSQSKFITIRGFTLTGGTGFAVVGNGGGSSSDSITIEMNIIRANGGGINMAQFNPNWWIVNNLIQNNTGHGVSLSGNGGGPIYIVNNTIFDNHENGISTAADKDLFIINNLIVRNGEQGGATGLRMGIIQVGTAQAARQLLLNNVLYRNGQYNAANNLMSSGGGDIGVGVLDATDSGNYTTNGCPGAAGCSLPATGIAGRTFADGLANHADTEIFVTPGATPPTNFQLVTCTSPALDRGLNSFVNAGRELVPALDQKGSSRSADADCTGGALVDAGFDEVQPAAPNVSPPGFVEVECDSAGDPAHPDVTGYAAATNACTGAAVTVSYDDVIAAGVCPVREVITRTWSATNCGGTALAVQTIHVRDTVGPMIDLNGPGLMTVELECGDDYVELGATATDACDGVFAVFDIDNTDVDTGAVGDYTVYYNAVDSCGNPATEKTRIVQVRDTTPPDFTSLPAPLTDLECEGAGVPVSNARVQDFLNAAVATDGCFGVLAVTDDAPAVFPFGTTTVHFSAVDGSGNPVSAQVNVTVVDTTPPSFVEFPGDENLQCTDLVPAPDAALILATDLCGAATVTLSSNTNNGGAGCTGDPRVVSHTYMAQDDHGNTASRTQTFTVVDTTPPTVNSLDPALTNASAQCAASGPSEAQTMAAISAASADNCSVAMVSLLGAVDNGGDGCLLDPLIVTRTYRVADSCDNFVEVVQTLSFADTEGPFIMLTGPGQITIECGSSYTDQGATAVDNCGGFSNAVTVEPIGFNPAAVGFGQYTFMYTAMDACGNGARNSVTRIVNVADTTGPTLSVPVAASYQCAGDVPPASASAATAADACGPATVTVSDSADLGSGCAGDPRTITRTFTAVDGHGNTTALAQIITVENTAAMTITLPANANLQANGNPSQTSPATTGSATAPARCGDAADISHVDVIVQVSCPMVIERTWTATYDCGSVSGVQTITVNDTTPPTFATFPPNMTVAQADAGNLLVTGQPTASDNSGSATVSHSDTQINPTRIDRTWTATDPCGNVVTRIQVITLNLGQSDCNGSTVVVDQNVTINMMPVLNGGVPVYAGDPDLKPFVRYEYVANKPVETWKVIVDMGATSLVVKNGATIRVSAVPPTTNNQSVPGLIIKGTCDLKIDKGGAVAITGLNKPSGRLSLLMGRNIVVNGSVVSETNGTNNGPGGITIASEHGTINTGPSSTIRTAGPKGMGIDIVNGCAGEGDIVIDGMVDVVYRTGSPVIRIVALDGNVKIDGCTYRGQVVENGTSKRLFTGVTVRNTHNPLPGSIYIQASENVVVKGNTILDWKFPNLGAVAVSTGSNSSVGGLIDVRAVHGNITASDRAFDNANRYNAKAKINLTAAGVIALNTTGKPNSVKMNGKKPTVDPLLMDVVSTQAGKDGVGGTNTLRAGAIKRAPNACVLANRAEAGNGGNGKNRFFPVIAGPKRIMPAASVCLDPVGAPLFDDSGDLGVTF